MAETILPQTDSPEVLAERERCAAIVRDLERFWAEHSGGITASIRVARRRIELIEAPEDFDDTPRSIREHLADAGAERVWLGTWDASIDDLCDASIEGGALLLDQMAIRSGDDLLDPADGGRWLTIRPARTPVQEVDRAS